MKCRHLETAVLEQLEGWNFIYYLHSRTSGQKYAATALAAMVAPSYVWLHATKPLDAESQDSKCQWRKGSFCYCQASYCPSTDLLQRSVSHAMNCWSNELYWQTQGFLCSMIFALFFCRCRCYVKMLVLLQWCEQLWKLHRIPPQLLWGTRHRNWSDHFRSLHFQQLLYLRSLWEPWVQTSSTVLSTVEGSMWACGSNFLRHMNFSCQQ